MIRPPQPTLLLIGPTGSGKTPLGRLLEARGWRGRRCHHFDFGAELRAAARRPEGSGLLPGELEVVRRSLETGALLEDEDFPVALKILRSFRERRGIEAEDLLVLNGLPRHAGQAVMIEPEAAVGTVIVLEAPPDFVRERIRRDTGGDRTGRVDDDLAAVEAKLEIFLARTRPLLEHYRAKGALIVSIPVAAASSAEDMWEVLAKSAA